MVVSPTKLMELGVTEAMAPKVSRNILDALAGRDPMQAWHILQDSVLSPEIPFTVHAHLFHHLQSLWPENRGPLPAWFPFASHTERTRLCDVMRRHDFHEIAAFHHFSVTQRTDFWKTMVAELDIRFRRDPEAVVDLSGGATHPKWLPGARMNIAESCFQADPTQAAIVLRRKADGPCETVTYAQLERLSNRVANGLSATGFQPGDAIAIDMPMTLEAVAAYLGIVKAGCVVVSIADSFSPDEIATRLRIADAKMVITSDVVQRGPKTLPMYAKVIEAGASQAVVIPSGASLCIDLRPNDLTWETFLSDNHEYEAYIGPPSAVLNILFSSGTTGEPKAIPWHHHTPIKCASDGALHHDIRHGDVVAWPTNLGWMMGPWLIFASLINRATIALYYDAPNTEGFCRFVADAEVTMLGVVPSLVKAWRQQQMLEKVDWQGIRAFSSTGECSNTEDMLYLMASAGYRPVIEYCGGTEVGGGYLTSTVIQANSPACFSTPAFGLDFVLLDEEGQPGDQGELFLVPPSLGLSQQLLNKNHDEVYYRDTPSGPEGQALRRHGDQVERLPLGFYRAHGRADDTMNLGGIKTSSAEIERCLNQLEGVTETAAVAVPPRGGGPAQLVIYAVLENDAFEEAALQAMMQRQIRGKLNPLFKIFTVCAVASLPRTASGKVMRRVLRRRYLEQRAP